jgi:hypothetical protein
VTSFAGRTAVNDSGFGNSDFGLINKKAEVWKIGSEWIRLKSEIEPAIVPNESDYGAANM